MADQRTKAEAFRKLHNGPSILMLPNAWDAASATILEAAGFPAIASTSAGCAWTLGYPDGETISRDEMAEIVGRICRAVDIPVSADMEAGYGPRVEDVAETARATIKAGAVGINIEDSTKGHASLHPIADAAARIRAARKAADETDIRLVINARTDTFFPPLAKTHDAFAEAVKRAEAYRAAGADSIFVPFVTDGPTIKKLASAIPRPINILAQPDTPSLKELEAMGVARVTVGGNISRAAYQAAKSAAEELKTRGTFTFAKDAITHPELNKLLS